MLRQYLDLKEQAGNALLLYRMGDFYELFFEDAQKAAPVLGITLTRRRQNKDVEAPMCGVPHHAFDGYLGKLLTAGYRVAVAEQVEDPATAKGLVRREIIRTHTPGTVSDTELLDGNEHCFLAALGGEDDHAALAWIEVSTGVFEGMECRDTRVLTEQLARLRPREILVAEDSDGWSAAWPRELPVPTVTPLPPEEFSPAAAEGMLLAAGVSSWTSIKPSLTSSQPVDQQIRSNLLSISAATPFGAVPVPSPAKAFLSNTVASLTSNSLITGNSMPSEGASYSAIGQGISGGLATAITGGNSAFAVPLQIILDWAIGGFFSSPEDTGKAQRVNEHLFRKEGGGWVWAEPGT